MLKIVNFLLLAAGLLHFNCLASSAEQQVAMQLDQFHHYASEANGEAYFAILADDAIFLGTDATERWTKEAFQRFAHPYFSKGKGWTYQVKSRNIVVDGQYAWFDELLSNASYGLCRGSGVLMLVGDRWLIKQYNLAIPVPNEKAKSVVAIIQSDSN